MSGPHSEYDVIVIGGGPNGLTAAAYLTLSGLKVLVCEKHPETGGGLVTQEVCGFKLNHHATYMLLSELMPPYRDLQLEKWGVQFIRPEKQMAFLFKDRTALIFYTDPEKSASSISDYSPEDAENFRKMWSEFEEMFNRFLLPATYFPPLEPIEQTEKLNTSDELGKKIAEISDMTPVEILNHYGIKDSKVRGALLYITGMFGIEPDEPVGFLVPIYILRILNASIIKGGSHFLSSCLRKVVEVNGGAVRTAAGVEKVIVEGSRASGVVFEDGTEIKAKAVISTLDPQQNFLKLLSDVSADFMEELKDAAERWEWEDYSLFTAHRGISGERIVYEGYPGDVNECLNVVMGYEGENDVLEHIQEVREGKFSIRGHGTITSLYDPLSIPAHVSEEGHTLLRWECWAPYDYDWSLKNKKEITRRCFEKWAEYAPAVASSRVIVEIAWSPVDIETHNICMKRGSIKHGAYLSLQMGYNRPCPECSSYRTPVEGFYVGGASVHPGGMVILGPGYNVARVVCKDLGVEWKWEEVQGIKEAKERGYL